MSFALGTLVATPSGERAIASLKVGDGVTAYDPTTRHANAQTVQHVWINHDTDLLEVTLRVTADPVTSSAQSAHHAQHTSGSAQASATASNTTAHTERIDTTANHPWLTAEHGWLLASFMVVGEAVVRADGATATVVAIRVVAGTATMWDLTVGQVHTFAVGAGQFVVH